MKLEAYQQSPIQDGDLVFGYRPGSDQPAILMSGIQSGNPEPDHPNEFTTSFVINRSDILAMHTFPVALVTPISGSGVQVIAPIALVVDIDGNDFTFASGETVDVFNESSGDSLICSFGDPCITSYVISSPVTYLPYHIPVDGTIFARASAPITGGGENATFTFIIKYRLVYP